MAVGDWSNTAASNTTIGGISIAPNCDLGNLDNSVRELMKQVKDWYDTVAAALGGGTAQPLDASLTAYAALTTAADKMLYFTGADTPATLTTTSFGRSLLNSANGAAVISAIGAGSAPVISGTAGSNCAIALGGGLILSMRDHNVTGGGSGSYAYGNSTTYTTWARAWMSGDDAVSNVSFALTSSGLSSATIFNNSSNPTTACTVFAIGV